MAQLLAAVLAVTLAACGGGGGGSTSGTSGTYTVGGSVSGLTAGGLTLANGSQSASVAANTTSFVFSNGASAGATYAVTVSAQPAGQTCTVSNGNGTIGSANVTNVQVSCANNNLAGTAATGGAIANATVTLADSTGKQVATTTDSSGNYSLSTAGLTAPFLVKVVTATASTNGYATGTTFYGVSDQASPSVINVTPLTDLIVRNWYAAQSTPVSISAAFANPASNPPPSVAAVRVIQAVVLDIVQPLLQQAGVNTVGLDLISGAFTANHQGVDMALDRIKPITFNSTGTAATLSIATTSTTTQTTTVTTTAGSTQVATTSTTTGGGTSSIVTTALVPTSAAQASALAGAQTTLDNLGATINGKGSALTAADVAPYIDPNFLGGGKTAAQQAQEIASEMAGATINSFIVTRIGTFDATNNLIGVVGTLNYTKGGYTGTAYLGDDQSTQGLIFKQQASSSWLMYGDQQQARSHALINSVYQNPLSGQPYSAQYLDVQVGVPAASTSTPCTSTFANSVTAFPSAAISGTAQGTNTSTTVATSGAALVKNSAVWTQQGRNECEFNLVDNGFLVLSPSSLPSLVGNIFGFAINGGAQVPALARTIAGYTTETINFTNLTSHALPAAQPGQSLTVNWSLPVTFPIVDVEVYGEVAVPSGTSFVSCSFRPTVPLAVTSTSATVAVPATCNGSSVASLTQPGPSAVQMNVVIRGSHGEVASAWWPFN